MSDLEQRLEKLERQIRRLRVTLFGLVAALVLVPLMGTVIPQELPEVIDARAFRVIGEDGHLRVFVHAGGSYYFDEHQKIKAWMDDDGIRYYDENDAIRVFVDARGIWYKDEDGRLRAQLGTDAEPSYPAAVVLYDAEGNVIWQAPR